MCTITTNATTPWYSGNEKRPIVLLDMDDVITNCLRSAVKNYNEENGTNFNYKDCKTWNLEDFLGVDTETVLNLFRDPGFFEKLQPKRGSVGAINELIKSTKYDIYIITATSDDDGSELVEKIKWFKKYIPKFNTKRIISCKDKYIIRGDVLVDDKVANLDLCAPYMQCVLMDSPTNQECDRYIRIRSLKYLPDLLEKMFYNDEGGIKYFEDSVRDEIIEETQNKSSI